eukprot:scaffold40027_cov23-Tisochrysis_lutea.AAC.1
MEASKMKSLTDSLQEHVSVSVSFIACCCALFTIRYRGQFYEGERSGYGVLYYATGARYEGCWAKDKKEGEGCYVFENGE